LKRGSATSRSTSSFAIAREVLSALGRKHMVIPGIVNRTFVLAQTRLMSRRRTVSSIGRFLEKGLDKSG
jgi:hypothetical protein